MSLASVAPSVWRGRGGGHADTHASCPDSLSTVLPKVEVVRAAQEAVALAQQGKSA